jgi:hypothetical protein
MFEFGRHIAVLQWLIVQDTLCFTPSTDRLVKAFDDWLRGLESL